MTSRSLELPADLVEFLRSGRRLDYDPATCEAGAVRLHEPDNLTLRTFASQHAASPDVDAELHDVPGVDLVAKCTGDYDPPGLLVWFPNERRYGVWDASHDFVFLFGAETSWSDIARSPARYINAQWDFDDLEREEIAPWAPSPANGNDAWN
ncbi:MAG TPA: hypothetical protein VGN57_17030 [Pirellulaceae bacterium]|nr:hypothetical protein [Pirellulaceae bacterium]